MKRTSLREAGFTLIEVIVISPVLMLTIIITMSFLFNQYGQLTQQGAQINLNIEAQNITFSMQDDVFYANAFMSTLSENLEDDHQPSGGWDAQSDPPTLIVSTPAETTNRRAEDRQPVYIDTLGCDASVLQENEPLYNNVVYFVEGTNLYKRVVTAPSTVATCGTSFMKQTCPADQVSATCNEDLLMTDRLETFEMTYYSDNNTETTEPEQATKVKINLQLKDRAFAEDIFSNSTITIKRLNT